MVRMRQPLNMKAANKRRGPRSPAATFKPAEADEEARDISRPAAEQSVAPERTETLVLHPNFVLRARGIWGKTARGKPLSRIIVEGR